MENHFEIHILHIHSISMQTTLLFFDLTMSSFSDNFFPSLFLANSQESFSFRRHMHTPPLQTRIKNFATQKIHMKK